MERQQIMGTDFLFSNFVFWFKMFYIGWGLWEKYKNNFLKFFKRGGEGGFDGGIFHCLNKLADYPLRHAQHACKGEFDKRESVYLIFGF